MKIETKKMVKGKRISSGKIDMLPAIEHIARMQVGEVLYRVFANLKIGEEVLLKRTKKGLEIKGMSRKTSISAILKRKTPSGGAFNMILNFSVGGLLTEKISDKIFKGKKFSDVLQEADRRMKKKEKKVKG